MDTEFVEKYYRMDPETEELIFGDQLEINMVVLRNAHEDRVELKHQNAWRDWERYKAFVENRWGLITDIRTEGTEIRFIAMYADGFKAGRSTVAGEVWIVRKETIAPGSADPEKDDVSPEVRSIWNHLDAEQ